MPRFILASALVSGCFAATPSFGQVYKWVDERGVVNYSNEAPADRTSTLLDPKSARVSVYSTDDAQKRAPGAMASADARALSEKIDRLERKLDAERYARQNLADSRMQAAWDYRYQQCLSDRRVDCDYAGMDPYPYSYYPYYGPAVVVVKQPRHFFNGGQVQNPIARPVSSGRMGLPRQM